jgi:hypothetical protein
MFYLERIDGERRKRLRELELNAKRLSYRLAEAEREIALQESKLRSFAVEFGEEAWADVIEE